jgi:cytochrome c peroxidase
MQDGSLKTLEEVIEFYDGCGRENPDLDRETKPFSLTGEEKKHLETFLGSLSGRITER